jgi:hypothetical protein
MLTHDADEWREKVRLVKKNYPVVKLRGNVARTRREQGSTKLFRLCQYRDGVGDMFPESEANDRLFATNGASVRVAQVPETQSGSAGVPTSLKHDGPGLSPIACGNTRASER